jgi:hypothetical protein
MPTVVDSATGTQYPVALNYTNNSSTVPNHDHLAHQSRLANGMVLKPTETEPSNPLRKGVIRYWGYINEMAEALAPQIRQAVPFKPLGADVVSWWSYRVVDLYAGLDGLLTFLRSWKENTDKKPFPRLWQATTDGGSSWFFQQLASVYLPATVVSGIRKGVDSALNNVPLTPFAGKKRLEKWLTYLEAPVSMGARLLFNQMKRLPGLQPILASSRAKVWTPTIMALATIPVIIKPIDKLSNALVNRTFKQGMNYVSKFLAIDKQSTPTLPSSEQPLMSPTHIAFNSFNTAPNQALK